MALLGEFDLAAVEAVNHKNPCYNSFVAINEVVNVENETPRAQSSNFHNNQSDNDNNSNDHSKTNSYTL